jgi:hypothetical protein
MEDTIVTLRFTDPRAGAPGSHELERLDHERRIACAAPRSSSGRARAGSTAQAAARDDEGHYLPPGGSVSLVLDVLGGPLGALSERPTEGFQRHHGPSRHDGEREFALDEISRSLEPGVTLVLAEIADPDPDVLESTLAEARRDRLATTGRDVYAEVRAAQAR